MTQSVQSGSLRTIFVPAGHTVTVSADSISAGNVYQQSNSTLLGAVAASGSLEIGPYPDLRGFIIVASLGTLTYGDPVLSVGGEGEGTTPSFTDLSDAPESYTGAAGRPVLVNDGETGTQFSQSVFIDDSYGSIELSDPNLDDTSLGALFTAAAYGAETRVGQPRCKGTIYAANETGGTPQVMYQLTVRPDDNQGAASLILEAIGGATLEACALNVRANGGLLGMPGLPTSDPAVYGAVWNDGGTLKVSAG